MRGFQTADQFDLAVCFNGSFQHLVSVDDVLAHLSRVGAALAPGGLYIVSLPAPEDFVSEPPGASEHRWSARQGDLTVDVDWTYQQDHIDWNTQTFSGLARIQVAEGPAREELWLSYCYRVFFLQELRALVALSDRFEVVETYGDLDLGRTFAASREPRSMIVVLRRGAT